MSISGITREFIVLGPKFLVVAPTTYAVPMVNVSHPGGLLVLVVSLMDVIYGDQTPRRKP
jgi:hypothetical protein